MNIRHIGVPPIRKVREPVIVEWDTGLWVFPSSQGTITNLRNASRVARTSRRMPDNITIVNEYRRVARFHIVRVEVGDGEVVGGSGGVVVADSGDGGGGGGGGRVELAELGVGGELAGVGPLVGGGVPEGVVPGGGDRGGSDGGCVCRRRVVVGALSSGWGVGSVASGGEGELGEVVVGGGGDEGEDSFGLRRAGLGVGG